MKRAAFFDFDGTLYKKSSAFTGSYFIIRKGIYPTPVFLGKMSIKTLLYKLNLINESEIGNYLITFYKNKPIKIFENLSEEYYLKFVKNNLNPTVIKRLEEHKRKGDIVVLLSASVEYFMEVVKEKLGFDYILCTKLEVDKNGICTGKTTNGICSDINKLKCVKEFAQKHDIDIENSFAYGNHHSDYHILNAIGNPVVVRPTRKLKSIAKRKNWEIIY